MSSSAESVLQDALRLPEGDRADIAARLIASLEVAAEESREAVEQAWAAEIEDVRRAIEADLFRK